MSNGTPDAMQEATLAHFHVRLRGHFADLHEARMRQAAGAPIFALEHGLSEAEVIVLQKLVRAAVVGPGLPREHWLPIVVYAAELGYVYAGEEYWRTFEARTPGWREHGDRTDVRLRFEAFADEFGGAIPTGAWARQFTIICWPITHAVLPTDLQWELARALFEHRAALTASDLEEPDRLGERLAARSWQAGARFRKFAENTTLLGQIAVSLLAGEGESPYLLASTQHRIVTDASKRHQTARWLRGAKKRARDVHTRGLRGLHDAAPGPATPSGAIRVVLDPTLSLEPDGDAWKAVAELPDLTPLGERFPQIVEELRTRRVRFSGVATPLARGRVLRPDTRLRLATWPRSHDALLKVEDGPKETNVVLADQCLISPGPPWLFRCREGAPAVEVRSKAIKPDAKYIAVFEHAIKTDWPAWVRPVDLTTDGIVGYQFDVPSIVTADDIAVLNAFDIGAVTDVAVRPTGPVPASWDGEGSAEWLEGEQPFLAITANGDPADITVTMNEASSIAAWPSEGPVFLHITDLPVGQHSLTVTVGYGGAGARPVEGRFDIAIRPSHARPSTGSFREGLMVLPTPLTPTLGEIWSGDADLEILGPIGATLHCAVTLIDHNHAQLGQRTSTIELPVTRDAWAELMATRIRTSAECQAAYDDADLCVITAWHDDLGTVELRCEREFTPLRWVGGEQKGLPFVRLISNLESPVTFRRYPFACPDADKGMLDDGDGVIRDPLGGLIVASAGEMEAGVILPPEFQPTKLADLRRLNVEPTLGEHPRSADGVLTLVALAGRWESAAVTANPFGELDRTKVLDALVIATAKLVGGGGWTNVEDRAAENVSAVSTRDLVFGVGRDGAQRALAGDICAGVHILHGRDRDERIQWFFDALQRHPRVTAMANIQPRVAEFLLGLATRIGAVANWPHAELAYATDVVLAAPVLLRAARCLVIALEKETGQGRGSWR